MEPWSPSGQPFGIAGAHEILYGLATDHESYNISYPASISVISHESSSPQPQGIHTPSSTRSPSFTQLHLPASPRTSLNSVAYSQDQDTPRISQHIFGTAQPSNQPYSLSGVGPSSQHISVTKRKRNEYVHREPTHSPSVSGEYVMVESFSKTGANTKRIDTKPSKASAPDMFYHEHYPRNEDKRPRKSNEFVARKTSNGRKSGGRSVGMHLAPEKAAKAKDLRSDGACWICCLQRDSVSSHIF
jgi:hypothetical protein